VDSVIPVPVTVMGVPGGPDVAESVIAVTAPSAGVTGIAIMSKARTTAIARILKNLLCFIFRLR
jgi:hypothetical protein